MISVKSMCVCVCAFPSVCHCFIYPHRSSDGVLSGCDRQTAFPGTQSQMALHAEFVLPGPRCQSVWDSNPPPPPPKNTHTHNCPLLFLSLLQALKKIKNKNSSLPTICLDPSLPMRDGDGGRGVQRSNVWQESTWQCWDVTSHGWYWSMEIL